jgi:cytochrome P450
MRSDVQTPVEPVSWDDQHHVYVVSGFEEAAAVLRGGVGWSSNPSSGGSKGMPLDLPRALVLMDPPDHTRLRSLLRPAFLPRVIERLRPRVAAIVNTVLDGLADKDEADIVADVGHVVPVSVMAELFGVGVEGAQLFVQQIPPLVRWLELEATPEDLQVTADAVAELTRFLTSVMDERRREPGDDFLSTLLAVGDELSTEDILATCFLVLAAGLDATGNLISNAALAVLRDPAQIPHLLADPGRAVEELLRMEGTSKQLVRIAVADHDFGGHQISQGQVVFVRVRDANRDPSRAPDAHQLDLSREPLGHLTFGIGPHFCLGAGLTRLELTETLVPLFTRFPGLTLTSREPIWRSSTSFRGLQELPVRLRG